MSSSLEHDLSEEVLDHIVSFSCAASLINLCLVSKKLARIATPHLYSTISFTHGSQFKGGIKDILPLTYLILTSSSHASYVRSFTIRDTWGEFEEMEEEYTNSDDKDARRPWPRFGTPELEDVLRKASADYAVNDSEAEEIYQKIKSGLNEDVILILLFANLPNLQSLDLNIGCMIQRNHLIGMLERVGNREKPFDKLPSGPCEVSSRNKPTSTNSVAFSSPIDVLVTGTDDKYPHSPDHLAAFLNLPNLRSLYAMKMGDEEGDPEEDNAFTRLKPRSCPVEYLEFRESKLHGKNQNPLLAATIPGRLKTFNYEIGCTWAWCDIDHEATMKALEPHYNTLECLGFSHEACYPYQFDNDHEYPSSMSYRCFKALKKLKVAPAYIFGHDGITNDEEVKKPSTRELLWKALPETLEELWITRADNRVEDMGEPTVCFIPDCLIPALELVVQHRAEATPGLRRLRIEFQLIDWRVEWMGPLASLCVYAEESGIRVQIITNEEFDYEQEASRKERGWGWDEDVEWTEVYNNEGNQTRIEVADEQDLEETLTNMFHLVKEEMKERTRKRNKGSIIPNDESVSDDGLSDVETSEQGSKTDKEDQDGDEK
ncbi:hypothetical protein K504DRAFT_467672 [Pleomassaria siparia CBS 279.74]|uniref:F-box domain-containing protein n=1 Tax=Pleomassaria siparia CBS 279.74 TaxID=1314801 RepID=A0A6G1KBA6_9PLEO|nr:hypothetical protein K504DRAFT_467672 [Pleomassaria siparia CBS 279.74]